jgi:hypothetical protein
MDTRNLPKPVKVAHRTKCKVAKSPDKLLKWTKDLNPGLHKKHWRLLDRQPEPKSQRLILLIDLKTSMKTGTYIFIGLIQGTVKILRDAEERPKQEEGAATSPVSSGPAVFEGERTDMFTHSGAKIAEWGMAIETEREMTPTLKLSPVDPGPPSERIWSDEK